DVLFGFLNAQQMVAPASITTIGVNSSNIITGALNSTIIGNGTALTFQPVQSVVSMNQKAFYGSNLILDTAGGATAYGNYGTVTFTDKAADNMTFTATVGALQGFQKSINNAFNFQGNAFNVSGTVYGITDTFTITAKGGS